MSKKFEIYPIDKKFDKASFDCGSLELNAFIHTRARQNQLQGFSTTFVAIVEGDVTKKVVGFYSLSMGEINLSSLPDDLVKKLPKHPVPVARMGRLAVDLNFQGQGLGKFLLVDSIKRVQSASATIGVYALLVDAKDEPAKAFYLKYGFIPLSDKPMTLFLPLSSFPK